MAAAKQHGLARWGAWSGAQPNLEHQPLSHRLKNMLCFPVPPIFSPSAHFFEHAVGKLTRRQAGPVATRHQNLQRSVRSAVARRAKNAKASSIPKPAADVAPRCSQKFPAPGGWVGQKLASRPQNMRSHVMFPRSSHLLTLCTLFRARRREAYEASGRTLGHQASKSAAIGS